MPIVEWVFANPNEAIVILCGILVFVIVYAFNQIGKPKIRRK